MYLALWGRWLGNLFIAFHSQAEYIFWQDSRALIFLVLSREESSCFGSQMNRWESWHTLTNVFIWMEGPVGSGVPAGRGHFWSQYYTFKTLMFHKRNPTLHMALFIISFWLHKNHITILKEFYIFFWCVAFKGVLTFLCQTVCLNHRMHFGHFVVEWSC